MNRRDLLKVFGVGALVAPVVDGIPSKDVARIIAPPRVELCERPPVIEARSMNDALSGCVAVLYFPGGDQYRFNVGSVSMDVRNKFADVTSLGDQWRQFVPTMSTCEVRMTVSGKVIFTPGLKV